MRSHNLTNEEEQMDLVENVQCLVLETRRIQFKQRVEGDSQAKCQY